MPPWRENAAIAAFASAAAALTALSDSAFGLGDSLSIVSFRSAAAFLIATVLLSAWGRVSRLIKVYEALPTHRQDQIATPVGGDETAPPFQRPLLTRVGEEISACNPIIHTLCDHVQTVVTTTEDVAINIMTELRKVDDIITGLIAFLRVSSRDKIMPVVEQAEVRLHANNQLLTAFLGTREASIETTISQLSCISDLAHRLEAVVQSIRRLARQTNMLALNASIEAARAGSAGKGFAVVASEVKALSLQTDQAAKDISDGLHSLNDAIAESQGVLQVRLGREREDLNAVLSAIGELQQNMAILIECQRATLAKMFEDGEAIAQLVIELNGSIQFQDVVRQRLNGVTGVLHQLTDHASGLKGIAELDEFQKDTIEDAFASIEMKRRLAHEGSQISHVSSTNAGALELF